MSKFGWDYPAGAANDPNAPYNQEEIMDNSAIKEAFSEFSGPHDVYRMTYKYTDCGPSVGFLMSWEIEADDVDASPNGTGGGIQKFVYCDDLRKFGSWDDLDKNGILITEISVSSIVEGVEQCTDTEFVDCDGLTFEPADIRKQFDDAVDAVDKQAIEIWKETHGCPDCFDYPEDEDHPIDPDCESCGGSGIII